MKFFTSCALFFLFLNNFSIAQTIDKRDSSHCIMAKAGMPLDEFNQILTINKFVLADFYADWCVPCKKLTPIIEEIASETTDSVTVIRINQDNNKPLFEALKVYELPTLLIYKNQKLIWTGEGVFPKEMIEAEFK